MSGLEWALFYLFPTVIVIAVAGQYLSYRGRGRDRDGS